MLMYMDMALRRDEDLVEQKKAEQFIQYLIAMYTRPPAMGEKRDHKFEQGKREFVESLKPKLPENKGPAKVYQWDEELMKRLAAQQNKPGGLSSV
ncbi:hypothetical protein CHH91_04625 [Virgibacillus sp. 7505]|uniref:hypothetical protein n=1 Tax=Virgibacillus sp. 7505 TaxID=2022548 RepID=UPI000BA5CCDF|nr:hypothetical protein [Virgibacillus sp. 7505]PAE17294.1 hypothetical protein CHH91_04625 [Virgibacillus sp. 7505]